MGIQGLLPFLKKLHTPVNIAQFQGQTAAIDAYCWLHKGAFSCAEKLALGEPTEQYVYFCMKYVEYMLRNGIKPILVFDGCHLPSKKGVETARRERRDIFKKKAAVFLREGKRGEARECLQRCIDVTPQMALSLMNACRARGVDCIVAPYEADAQLAYLNKLGIAQIIVTEDSDLLLFGCEKIIFKMDFNGNGILLERSRLNEVLEIQTGFYTFDKFRYLCILSGCDYLPSLHGVGLGKAVKVFRSARQADIQQLLKKLSAYIKLKSDVPPEYIEGFIKANNTFLYQLAFDPVTRKLVPLNPYSPEIDSSELTYAGPFFPDDRAYQIALGNIDINTGETIGHFNPHDFQPSKCNKNKSEQLHLLSIWDKNYRPMPKIGLKEIQPTERPVLKGKEVKVETRIVKRPRVTTDFKDVKSDNELVDLYEECMPVAKKPKIEHPADNDWPESDDKAANENTSFSSCVSDVTQVTSPVSSLDRSSMANIGEVAMKIKEENKENTGSALKRNRFAVSSLVKKKFNLNAPKVEVTVRSRFFAKAEDTYHQSKLGTETENTSSVTAVTMATKTSETPQHSVSSVTAVTMATKTSETPQHSVSSVTAVTMATKTSETPQHSVGSVTDSGRRDDTAVDKLTAVSTGQHKPTGRRYDQCSSFERTKASPGSAFNWNKFKYGQTKTSESSTHAKNDKLVVNTAFKPVTASRKKSSDFFSSFVTSYASKSDLLKFDSSGAEEYSSQPDTTSCQSKDKFINSTPDTHTSFDGLNDTQTNISDCLLSSKDIPVDSISIGQNSNEFSCESVTSDSLSILGSTSQSFSAEIGSETKPDCRKPDAAFSRLQRSASCSLFSSSGESVGEYETFSQRSNLESIDSDCLSSQEVIDLTDVEEEEEGRGSQRASLTQTNTKTKICRISGLSKTSNKKKEKIIAVEKQKSIKDMFSKFALKRPANKFPANSTS